MDIVMPWPPLVMLLVVSFLALYAGLLICHVEKPVLYKVALATLIPWVLAVVVIWISEMSPTNDANGLFWLWTLIITVLGYLIVQFLLIWKFLGVKLGRALLALLAWGVIIVLFMGLIVLYIRLTDVPHVSVNIK